MIKPIEIKPGIYSVGAVDWNIRNFHGYSTDRGTSYNAFLIVDEKIALIDTVKSNFADVLLENISAIVPPEKIDYIISNHAEPDHSGALPAVAAAAPNAVIITSAPQGLKHLTAHYGELNYQGVKAGESISLGKHTLIFTPTAMVHWPDNMVTYCPEEKLLFSNDAFGAHYACANIFDDENSLDVLMQEVDKYYANIVLPYAMQTRKALTAVSGLELDMIAPAHGLVWRSYVADVLTRYEYLTSERHEKKAVVVYDSMWGSTEKMAHAIVKGFLAAGYSVGLYDLKVNHISDIMTEVMKAEYIVVGSPTLNNNMMPTVAAFLAYMKGLAPKNRKSFAFGSYGWGGQSIALVNAELEACKFEIVLDQQRICFIPDEKALNELSERVFAVASGAKAAE
jgi:flavorubredoxin